MERVHDAVGSAFHTTTEGVVVTVVVVVSHLASRGMINYSSSAKNLDLRRWVDWLDRDLTLAARRAGVGLEGGSLISLVVRDVELGVGRSTVVRDGLTVLVGLYTRLLIASVGVIDVVGLLVDTTTIITLSDV